MEFLAFLGVLLIIGCPIVLLVLQFSILGRQREMMDLLTGLMGDVRRVLREGRRDRGEAGEPMRAAGSPRFSSASPLVEHPVGPGQAEDRGRGVRGEPVLAAASAPAVPGAEPAVGEILAGEPLLGATVVPPVETASMSRGAQEPEPFAASQARAAATHSEPVPCPYGG